MSKGGTHIKVKALFTNVTRGKPFTLPYKYIYEITIVYIEMHDTLSMNRFNSKFYIMF